ncbi:Protein MGARP [Microtus ochrogaster]|uniref:Protein MGARP n=1 Tax=Microtus ochrogaster TaxID=79684 RepID=A0A8J6G717_MICOH|nr:Protein MGARP [Microtus ochrogaster]
MYLRRAVSKTLALPRRAPSGPVPLGKDGGKENVAEAGAGEISVKETELVHAEEVPKAAAGPPEGSPTSPVPSEAALEETSTLREETDLKITEASPGETTEGVPEPTAEVESAAPEPTEEVEIAAPESSAEGESAAPESSAEGESAAPEPTEEVESAAPEPTAEVESAAADQADGACTSEEGEGTAGNRSCQEGPELEESPPLGSEPSAQQDSQEETTEVSAEGASPQG